VPHELAEAIAITLSIDQESRPPDAAAFAESMRAGAEGISPFQADSPTRHLGTRSTTRVLPPGEDPTAATRIAPTTGTRRLTPQTAETPVPRRAARAQPPAEYRRRQAVAEPAAKRRRSGRGARRLGLFLMLALVFTAAVVIAVVIATSTSSSVVQLKKIVGNDAQSVINALQNLINSNTK
jgi:hypothetical protein